MCTAPSPLPPLQPLLGVTTHEAPPLSRRTRGPVPEISSPQIRNANYVLSRPRVNKILKQQCLLRLSLQVSDRDYGIVQILVWPEIGGSVELWITQ